MRLGFLKWTDFRRWLECLYNVLVEILIDQITLPSNDHYRSGSPTPSHRSGSCPLHLTGVDRAHSTSQEWIVPTPPHRSGSCPLHLTGVDRAHSTSQEWIVPTPPHRSGSYPLHLTGVDRTHSTSQKWIIPTPPHTSYCIVVQCSLKPLPMRRTLHIPFTPIYTDVTDSSPTFLSPHSMAQCLTFTEAPYH